MMMNQSSLFKNLTNDENNKMISNSLQLDKVVTVETCFYYMSLLESFYEVEQSLGPELFKLFIIAGERRYLDMLHNASKGNHILEWNDKKPVPLDVAYAWHAHLLAPQQYVEDVCFDTKIELSWTQNFPLKAMYEHRKNGQPNQSQPKWTNCFYTYPFQLTKEELTQTSPLNNNIEDKNQFTRFNNINDTLEGEVHARRSLYIHCASCNTKIYFANWIDYAAFRTDPSVVIKCPGFNCKHPDNNVDSMAIANLLSALSSHRVKGTKLNTEENKNDLRTGMEEERTLQTKIKERIDSSNNVYYGSRDWDALLDAIATGINEKSAFSTYKEEKKYSIYATEFSNIIQATYKNNPLGLSLDLVQAMLNQRQFIHTMVKKIAPAWKDSIEAIFPQAIKDYHDFLLLLKIQKNPKDQNTVLPTWVIDMVWHVHMLHPSNYFNMTQMELGQVPNHCMCIAPSQMKESLEFTKKAWNQLPPSFTKNVDFAKMKGFAHRTISKKAARENKIYDKLRDKFINGGNMKSRMLIISIEDISYHSSTTNYQDFSIVSKKQRNHVEKHQYQILPIIFDKLNSTSTLVYHSSKGVEMLREHILFGVAYTGYGYIGTILDEVIRGSITTSKRIVAKTYAPWDDKQRKKWTKRCYGCIPPGNKIVIYRKNNPEYFLGKYEDSHFYTNKEEELPLEKPLKKEERENEWWIPQNSVYGMMRRSYSKKHQRWGWTTNGLDWYSEDECCFETIPPGKFTGATFIPPASYRQPIIYTNISTSTATRSFATTTFTTSTKPSSFFNFNKRKGGSSYGGFQNNNNYHGYYYGGFYNDNSCGNNDSYGGDCGSGDTGGGDSGGGGGGGD